MFDRILFPTDGSPNANKALDTVKELAQKFSSKVYVLTTYELPVIYGRYEIPAILTELDASLHTNCRKIAEDTVNNLKQAGIDAVEFVLKGDAGENIVDVAKEYDATLIVVGSRGLGAIKGFLIGSVSNYVLHHTKTPVLVIKE